MAKLMELLEKAFLLGFSRLVHTYGLWTALGYLVLAIGVAALLFLGAAFLTALLKLSLQAVASTDFTGSATFQRLNKPIPIQSTMNRIAVLKSLVHRLWRPFLAAYVVAIGWLSLSGRLISASDHLQVGRLFFGAPLFAFGVAYLFELAWDRAPVKRSLR